MLVALVVLGLGLLVLVHEGGHAAAARALRMRIVELSVGLGPAWATLRWGRSLVRFGFIPFGGYVRVAELSPEDPATLPLDGRSALRRLTVIGAGSFANYLVAAVLGVISAATWGIDTGRITGLELTAVSNVARAAGLQTGDVLLAVDRQPVRRVPELTVALRRAAGQEVELEVRRAGASMALLARPIERNGRVGLGARYVSLPELREATPSEAVAKGLALPLTTAAKLLRNGAQMLVPGSSVRPLSPVGLADRVSRSGRWDGRRALGFAALLSVVVGLFNLLPLPGLDGGRVLIELVQAARRRVLSPRFALGLQLGGALVLLLIWLLVVLGDVAALGR